MPTVSVITPCYNAAPFIEATLQSVREQTFTDWEHIVVDDGSTDASADAVTACLPADSRLHLVSQANRGVCAARNFGVQTASPDSDYLLFLDADDLLRPTMLAEMTAYLDKHPEVGLLYCDLQLIDEQGTLISQERWTRRFAPTRFGVRELPPNVAPTPFETVFGLSLILPSLALIRRTVYKQTPGWDEDFGQGFEDSDLFFQVALRSCVHFYNQPLVCHRRHPNQSTASPNHHVSESKKQELYRKWRHMDHLSPKQKNVLHAARVFVDGKLIPYHGFVAGVRHLRNAEYTQAFRFFGGAVKRILLSALRYRSAFFRPASPTDS